MNNISNNSSKYNIGCMPWAGVMLSIAIIATRAFQNGAQPIESWSAKSWCLMLLPAVLPIVISSIILSILLVGWILAAAFSKN